MAFVSLVFPEAKMLWQPRVKVFVLILPSRHEPLAENGLRFRLPPLRLPGLLWWQR